MIYTKTGDKGTTALVSGRRVAKCDLRVDAYGSADELNAHVGLLYECFNEEEYKMQLRIVQCKLFAIQTLLATDDELILKSLPQITVEDICIVEKWIDSISVSLPKLQSFVLPCGSKLAAQCHIARTVCRRVERIIVALSLEEVVNEYILAYINRLSDYLFVLARKTVYLENQAEVYWKNT